MRTIVYEKRAFVLCGYRYRHRASSTASSHIASKYLLLLAPARPGPESLAFFFRRKAFEQKKQHEISAFQEPYSTAGSIRLSSRTKILKQRIPSTIRLHSWNENLTCPPHDHSVRFTSTIRLHLWNENLTCPTHETQCQIHLHYSLALME